MKRNANRIISLWAAVLMVFNIVMPAGAALADGTGASATYENGLPVDFSDGPLSPETILGPAVEYGVVANKYDQTGHTETNFAVKEFQINNSQSIEIIGSGDAPIPFYIGQLSDGTRFWNGQATNVVFDVFINKNQADHGKPHENKHVVYSNDYPPTNVYGREKDVINAYVDTLLNYAASSSNVLANKQATCRPNPADKTIDLTTQGYPKEATIYVDCTHLKNVYFGSIAHTGETASIDTIDGYAFHNCKRMNWFKFPESVSTIGYGAFLYHGTLALVGAPG